jgi:hypothetical protein
MTESLAWRKSSYCADAACVEVATDGDYVLVRDSKRLQQAPYRFSKQEWNAFLDDLAASAKVPS